MKTINKYLAQALNCYPYDIEGALDALDYALSANANDTAALTLYGKILAENVLKYEEAIGYYQQALAADIYALEVYLPYLHALIQTEAYEEAENLAEYALTIKGINKYEIAMLRIQLYEKQQEYEKAEVQLKEAKKWYTNNWEWDDIESAEKRISIKKELAEPVEATKEEAVVKTRVPKWLSRQ